MPADRCQKIIEIMRHAAGKLPDRLHFLALNKLSLQGFQLGRIVQNAEKHGSVVLHRAAKRDLQEKLLSRPNDTYDFRFQQTTSFGRILKPVGYRPPHALDQFEQRRQRLLSQGKDANRITACEGSGWRTWIKEEKPSPLVVGGVMGMTIYQALQRGKFSPDALFQANGRSPAMDEADLETRDINGPFLRQGRPNLPPVHIPTYGD